MRERGGEWERGVGRSRTGPQLDCTAANPKALKASALYLARRARYLGCISTSGRFSQSRLHSPSSLPQPPSRCISAASRLYLGCISAVSRRLWKVRLGIAVGAKHALNLPLRDGIGLEAPHRVEALPDRGGERVVERAGGGAGRLRDAAPALLEQEGVVEGTDKGEGEEVLEQLLTERRAEHLRRAAIEGRLDQPRWCCGSGWRRPTATAAAVSVAMAAVLHLVVLLDRFQRGNVVQHAGAVEQLDLAKTMKVALGGGSEERRYGEGGMVSSPPRRSSRLIPARRTGAPSGRLGSVVRRSRKLGSPSPTQTTTPGGSQPIERPGPSSAS